MCGTCRTCRKERRGCWQPFSSPGVYAWESGERKPLSHSPLTPLRGPKENGNYRSRLSSPGVNAWATERSDSRRALGAASAGDLELQVGELHAAEPHPRHSLRVFLVCFLSFCCGRHGRPFVILSEAKN